MKSFKRRPLPSSIFVEFENPIRAEIFSTSRLESHAESLAYAQKIMPNPRKGKTLHERVHENRQILETAYNHILKAVEEKKAITPAAEWLVDNFHIIRTQLKDIRDHLPPGYYRELPKIAEGDLAGLPRVYGIAWAYVAHTDSRFDPELLKIFIAAYQRVQPLTIGELWAISISLKLVLVENLRRISARIVGAQIQRHEADFIADSLLGVGEAPLKKVEEIIISIQDRKIYRSFAVQLLQRLRFQETRVGPLLQFLDQNLAKQNQTIENCVTDEHNSQSTGNTTTRNVITSSRLMATFDWLEFFEETSPVDKILRDGSDFGSMDFATRDRYRHQIEDLSRYSKLSEIEVSVAVISAAVKNPGYYLLGEGRAEFEASIHFQTEILNHLLRWYVRNATFCYLASIALLTVFFTLITTSLTLIDPIFGYQTVTIYILAAILSSEIAIAFINRSTIALLGPKHLPRLSFESGITEENRTMIVVPTMLKDEKKIKIQLQQIEIHYLSNKDDNIYLALLTDFYDSKTEKDDNDIGVIASAFSELKLLNDRYPMRTGDHPRFSIYHRQRRFNPNENCWMGWERKRGKLHEFNRLLLGAKDTTYQNFFNDEIRVPSKIRYVITLDADTKMPRGSARQLVGAMAHPLNKPVFDVDNHKVISGYGILQPRITPTLANTFENTIFRKLSTSRSGVDPYASSVSDIYQDLFAEGSYTGKGIYDLEAFDRAMSGRIPDNSVLSHDLLEGNFVRCGFLSDVEFFEDFPSHTEVANLRTHRWMRGDWQLLPWIFGLKGRSISLINRWKMIDNLRRSLIAPANLILFYIVGTVPEINGWLLLALLLMNLLTPILITLWADLWPKHRHTTVVQHLFFAFEEFRMGASRIFLALVFIPHAAWTTIDAIARVQWRLLVSHRKMLEWTTASHVQSLSSLSLKSFVTAMYGAAIITVLGATVLTVSDSSFIYLAVPVLLLWIASPVIAWRFSQPPKARVILPMQASELFLMQTTARRIWRFFEIFVTVEDNYLPPDNFQEDPIKIIAHRSSPTNFGLYLLSIFAAKDFGWIGTCDTVEHLELSIKSLDSLEKHQGHFFNWYDTSDKRPLEPRYISSVDNGNLTGHLFTVAQGCVEILESPIKNFGFNKGILDTILILNHEINSYKAQYLDPGSLFKNVVEAFNELSINALKSGRRNRDHSFHWKNLCKLSNLLIKQTTAFLGHPPRAEREEIHAWSLALHNDILSGSKDYFSFKAWSEFLDYELDVSTTKNTRDWWKQIQFALNKPTSLSDVADHFGQIEKQISEFKQESPEAYPEFLDRLSDQLAITIKNVNLLNLKINSIQTICKQLIQNMDFNLLYDKHRKLFSIGMRVAENQLDPSYYDLLASEARLTSFIAIAKGDIPVSHWFHLGRSLINVNHKDTALVSWSGSMFEYLMPCLVMSSPEGSLLDQTCRRIIERQIQYGEEMKVPWGISESAYNKRDLSFTYQYSTFGVPDLGLKRGLGADLVIAPYASILAALFEPAQTAKNLKKLQEFGAYGSYGFYEAVDFTASRLPSGRTSAVVKTYMTHHQGMALVTLANVFKDYSMQRRFHADPSVRATELILQEKTPLTIGTLPVPDENISVDVVKEPVEHVSRQYHSVNRPTPTTQLLSNGDYTVMMTSAGSGFSRVHDLAINRWREDVTLDHYGHFFFIKDCENQNVWSAGYQPICSQAKRYEAQFAEDRVRVFREEHSITTELEVFVSPEENAEVRSLTVTNIGFTSREIEVTSYFEVVINSQGADVAHPAFSNLFIETEYNSNLSALFACRRPRSVEQKKIWLMHVLKTDQHSVGPIQFETDRSLFIGRGKSLKNPSALFDKDKLSGTVGPILDPIMSLRTRVHLKPGETAHLVFSTGIADTKENIEIMAEKFIDPSIFARVSDLTWTQAQVKLHHLGIEPDEAHLFQRLATRMIYSDPTLRPPSEVLQKNTKDLGGLWALGISGDHPIILVRIDDIEERGLIRQLLKAQIYFATKGFISDLVILNEKGSSYSQELQTELEGMAQAAHIPSDLSLTSGKVFVIRGDLISDFDHILLLSEARAILSTWHGSLSDQIKRTQMQTVSPRALVKPRTRVQNILPIPKLQFFNGYGGFNEDGKEYVIVLNDGLMTPAPWINVIANPSFGFQVSEIGSGYTWSGNSRENQLTPWSNDPVTDPPGEAIYIRDLDSGALWSPTAAPIRLNDATYLAHHGQGYSLFKTSVYGINSELKQFVLENEPIKISSLTLENKTVLPRRLSVTSYVEWVLGFSRSTMAPTTITEFNQASQVVIAFNPRNPEYGKEFAFHAALEYQTGFTCDRTEFIGRNSSLSKPMALLKDEHLKGKIGGGLDPCSAIQSEIVIKPGEKIELSFVLGQTSSRHAVQEFLASVRKKNLHEEFLQVQNLWTGLLGKIQVETPDRSFDIVLNRWYLYQTIVCRLWARAAFYQAGGAFGFRDQLQDVMALLMTSPQLAREQIVRAANRQFLEGDVQHWWHPPLGRGVRTRFSDDLLWLPYVVEKYIKVTNDRSILDEVIQFIEGPILRLDQEDSYYAPAQSQQSATLYEHCARALNHSLKTGIHNLPLMGGGDWNDGMNHVGIQGKGESVWLAWFLIDNLRKFSEIAKTKDDLQHSGTWLAHSETLTEAVERNSWDGSWYHRAYYDDGTPLGSAKSLECQIDSLAQSWSVISMAGQKDRAKQAMESVYQNLVDTDAEMILLFTKPFDTSPQNPGYIKGYLPGVRENGGQYTHAAAWVVIASAMLEDGNKAFELFSFLNPIHHATQMASANRYRLEPYVLAGDVYSVNPNRGHGGWSWYTGAAGWMYQAGIEHILGFRVFGNVAFLKPRVPDEWKEFKINYQFGKTRYEFQIRLSAEKNISEQKIALVDDGKTHLIQVIF